MPRICDETSNYNTASFNCVSPTKVRLSRNKCAKRSTAITKQTHGSDQVDEEYLRRKEQLRFAPPPTGENIPEWMRGGIEELYGCFNDTADLWDKKFGVDPDNPFYQTVARQIPTTQAEVDILDLGCGTGIQLEFVFARAPNARVTGIDLAPNMLEQLRYKFGSFSAQMRLVQGSLLDLSLGEDEYDYAISTLTMHHLPPEEKVRVYGKVRKALRPTGLYVEGDQSNTPEGEKNTLYWYNRWIAKLPGGNRAEWNYDITLTVETQKRLLREAGFSDVQLEWENPGRLAVLAAAY